MSALGDAGTSSLGTSKLGRYELISRIGEGGMAEVQLALQRGPAGFEKLVVVKLVHESLASQRDFVDMLLDEARVAALLKHPNVVDIYDLGEDGGRYFIAMEYLEGEPLLAVLRAGRDGNRLDILSTARLVADAAEGLDAAHELRSIGGDPLGLVHHDISLGNIVVLYNGQVKLVDFGVAKATQSVSQNRRIQGKFSYMAPEKLRGEAGDRRSDIWSLGCVLWEALTLKRLFKGASDRDTIRQVLESEVPVPSQVNGDVLPDFDPIALRALQRDPELRYPTAAEMAADLEELLRTHRYSGKNDRIAKYMQATFASHIEARKRMLQEVSSKGRASPAVLEAAFDAPAHTSVSPVRPDFARRFKTNTIDPPLPRAPSPSPAQAAEQPLEYPRAKPSDLPLSVAPVPESAELSTEGVLPRIDEEAPPARRSTQRRVVRARGKQRAVLFAAAGGAAAIALIAVLARGGGDGAEANAAPEASVRIPAAQTASAHAPPPPVDEVIEIPAQAAEREKPARERDKPAKPKADLAALQRAAIQALVDGDAKTAMALYKRAIAANPSFADAWRGKGVAHEKLGDRRGAVAAYRRYLELAPNARDAASVQSKIAGLQ